MKQSLIILTLLLSGAAWADGNTSLAPATSNLKWKNECSACHMAYPPALLPERSWRKMMAGLESHFGQDASLDALTAKEITAFLVNNSAERAGNKRAKKVLGALGPDEAPLRISETAWFVREHEEVSPQVWKRPKIGSPANCNACHQGAEQGNYSEHQIRIPR
ncbi:MAG: diheme cytochrome c [Sulfuricella denitrificans]|nr:diheme cytochrome c [Sulfuricella denitrificans]